MLWLSRCRWTSEGVGFAPRHRITLISSLASIFPLRWRSYREKHSLNSATTHTHTHTTKVCKDKKRIKSSKDLHIQHELTWDAGWKSHEGSETIILTLDQSFFLSTHYIQCAVCLTKIFRVKCSIILICYYHLYHLPIFLKKNKVIIIKNYRDLAPWTREKK